MSKKRNEPAQIPKKRTSEWRMMTKRAKRKVKAMISKSDPLIFRWERDHRKRTSGLTRSFSSLVKPCSLEGFHLGRRSNLT